MVVSDASHFHYRRLLIFVCNVVIRAVDLMFYICQQALLYINVGEFLTLHLYIYRDCTPMITLKYMTLVVQLLHDERSSVMAYFDTKKQGSLLLSEHSIYILAC